MGSWTIGCLCAALLCSVQPALAKSAQPSDAERAALAQLGEKITGMVVWESNRTGQWELYGMNADGTGTRRLTSLSRKGDPRAYKDYLRPRISPDGKTVLFGYGKSNAPAEVWLVPAAGGQARKLTVGNALNWSADGKEIIFVRDSQVWRHELATGKESVVHRAKVPTDGSRGSMVGSIRADLRAAVFRTSRSNEYFVFERGETFKKTGGCEPHLTPDGRYMYWVQGPKNFRLWHIASNKEVQLLGEPPVKPFNYTYFPTVSHDGRWLLYGASPGQHSHTTSDYECYIQELHDWKPVGMPVRLSFDTATDRWPYLYVAAPGSANPLPARPPEAIATAAVTPPAQPLDVFTFASKDAGPDFGGNWGLWPQLDDCRGLATFMAGDDAEAGAGGSMRIDYTIAAEPRSFSLWITPGGGTVNLTDYDCFVIHAKGNVPSFIIVVKDKNAGDPDAPTGIADYLVQGVEERWQRFELPFTGFKPRAEGARVDWPTINHVGIALIAPRNEPSGRLHVDNLRVLPAAAEKAGDPSGSTGPGHRLVYETYRGGNWDLYIANSDGSHSANLTRTPDVNELYPHVSPDGTKVCFVVDEGEGEPTRRDVYYMNLNGTGRTKVAENARQACWSPDGKAIAYLKGEFDEFTYRDFATKELVIYDLATGTHTPHPNTTLHHLYNICWSPDGNWFVATVHGGMGYKHAILAFEANGTRVVDLGIPGCRPDISPDGKKITWGPSDWALAVADLDLTGPEPRVTNRRDVVTSAKPMKIYHSDWSPDGKSVAFSRGPTKKGLGPAMEIVGVNAAGWDICVADASATNKWVTITDDGRSNKEPDWVPGPRRAAE
jgi:Tol biopolymer transport system component